MRVHSIEEPHPWLFCIGELNKEVFAESMQNKMQERLKQYKNTLLLTIGTPDNLIAYKWGYELNPKTYYSWLGAVHPNFRGQGLGKQLMLAQHQWCQERGYQSIQTKTLNRWKPMLILNLALGFDIVHTKVDSRGETKILLEKKFN